MQWAVDGRGWVGDGWVDEWVGGRALRGVFMDAHSPLCVWSRWLVGGSRRSCWRGGHAYGDACIGRGEVKRDGVDDVWRVCCVHRAEQVGDSRYDYYLQISLHSNTTLAALETTTLRVDPLLSCADVDGAPGTDTVESVAACGCPG